MKYAKSYIEKQGNVFNYVRRVPKRFQPYDSRARIKVALKTSDFETAIKLAAKVNEETEKYWSNLLQFGAPDAEIRKKYEAAVQIARDHNYQYKTLSELLEGNVNEIVRRYQTIAEHGPENEPLTYSLLGAIEKPSLTINDALEEFYILVREEIYHLDDQRLRKWKSPKARAVSHFIGVCGNMEIDKIKREHALEFKRWWMDRIEEEGIKPNTPNKDLSSLSKIYQTVSDDLGLQLDNPFKGLRFSDTEKSNKLPFKRAFIEEHLLNPEKLSELNLESKMYLYVSACTGAGITELIYLVPEDIILKEPIDWDTEEDGPFVPFIHIRKNRIRDIKNNYRDRKIPLTGAALWAMKQIPEGFTNYRDKDSGSFSAQLNKYLSTNGLRPTPNHTLNSLRHSFKDALRKLNIGDELMDSLMGHKNPKPNYGEGYSLQKKAEVMELVSFASPSTHWG